MPKGSLVVALALVPASAAGAPLDIVRVGAPAINCVFDARCTVVVTDTTADIALDGGIGFLQSRTFTGQLGSPAAGLTGYEYRIDLRNAVAVGGAACITSLTVDFGPIVTTLDYNADGATGEHVYVVTSGGLGAIGPSSASQLGSNVTFSFAAPVCTGGRPGAGASTYFFGLVSEQPPREMAASYVAGGRTLSIAARAPLPPGPEAWVVNHLGPSGVPPIVSRLRHRPARVVGGVDLTATDPVCTPRCGGSVHDVAFSPDGREAYLAHGGSLWVFDAGTRSLVADVDTSTDTDGDGVPEILDDHALSVSADGSRAYVVNVPGFSGTKDLTVIDLVRRRVLGYVNVGETFPTHPPAVTPDGRWAFLVYFHSGPGATDEGIAVVDTSTLSVARRLPRPSDEWSQIALSPDGRRLYAPRPGAIDVLDVATLAWLDAIPVAPALGVIRRVVVSRDGAYVYVMATRAGGATVLSVLDVAGRSWLWTEAILGLGFPAGFDVAGSGEFAVATDAAADTAYLIELSRGPSGTEAPRYLGVYPLRVGREPLGVRIRP